MPKIKNRQERWQYFGLLGGVSMSISNMGKIIANKHATAVAKAKAAQILEELKQLEPLIKDK